MFQPNGKPGADIAHLREHLKKQSVSTLRAELDSLLEEEASAGIETNPQVIEAYINAIEAGCPGAEAGDDFDQAWNKFTASNPDLFRKEKQPAKSSKRPIARFVEVAVLIAAALALSAAAFHWPDYVVKWGEDLFKISPDPSGIMALQEPSVDGYTTLEDALIDIGAENAPIPTWIPERFTIKTIVTQNVTIFKIATALYQSDNSELRIRVAYYPSEADMPDLEFEKNADNQQETYVYEETTYYIYENMDTMQITWRRDNCLCSVSGILSKKEAIAMIHSVSPASPA